MANPYGWKINPAIPGHMGPYSREVCGWLTYIEITQDGVYAIQPSEMSSQIYVIRQGFPDGEYLVIENRQQVKWDMDWPGNGVIIWHMDELAPLQTKRSWPGKAGWPADHFRVAVLSPDGNYDLEKGNNLGDKTDFWVQGMTLGPSSSEWPNTMAYQGGNLLETGISITILSQPGFIMNFQVSGLSGSLSPGPPDDPDAPVSSNASDEVLQGLDGAQYGPNTNTGSTIAWILSMLGGLTVVAFLMVVLM
jgi:immune inhibitor A